MDYIMIGPYQFDRDASKADMRLDYCSSFQEVALDESSLSFDTVSVEVCTTTIGAQLSALPNNTPIIVYRGGEIKARFVSSGVSRIGPVTFQLTGRSPMGALTGMVHTGGIYTGQTVEDVVKEICGNIPSLIKSVYSGVKLYGWLPYADGKERSARDNLSQVLFAIGAYLRTDLNGVLRIEPLWDGTASLIDVDRSYTGGTVKYDSPISAVTVTEHQYVAGTEVKELFSGTAQNGDIITFSEPMHSLSATGFTILESGANYAKISAGAGALTGKAYIHNTRLITQLVTAGAVENIKSVTDATLVSLVNSYAVAKRLADYYRCRETITNDIVSGHEKPGHVVSVYHPYDMLCKELDELIRKGELGAGDLDIAHKLTDTIKNIDKIEAMDERGYSGRYLDDDLRGYSRGSSYARRHYVRGHYSRTDATEHLRSQINDMMRETDDDRIKDALRRAMDMMED